MALDKAWFQAHKTEVMVGGAGIVVTIALYMRSKANSSGAGTTAATQSYGNPATVADTTTADLYDNLANQIQGLGSSVANLTATKQQNAWAPPTNEQQFGSGFGAPGAQTEYESSTTPVQGMDQGAYYSLDDAQIWNAVSQGTPIYNQVEPGDFQLTTNVNAGPVFLKAAK